MSELTVPEAAKVANRNPETIRRWIREGKLGSRRIGTQHLVDADEVAGMLPVPELNLPTHWQVADVSSMPRWEQIVKDGRESH